jgi:predicted P-loop ATPase
VRPGYEEGVTSDKWRSFGRNTRLARPTTFRAVIGWAQEDEDRRNVERYALEWEDLDEEELAAAAEPATESVDGDDEPSGGDFGSTDDGDDDPLKGFDTKGSLITDWSSLLDRNKDDGGLRPTLHNVELIVCNDPRLVGLAQHNEFTQEIVQRQQPGRKALRRATAPKPTRQLEGRVWRVKDTLNGDLWSEDRDFAIRSILEAPASQGGYGIKITDRDLKAAVTLAANLNPFHPVREYLTRIVWDGAPRVDTLFIDYLGSPDDNYTRSVARIVLIAAVCRIFEPGHKFDFALILEGLQGKRKSTFIEILARRWFAELDGDFHDPKMMIELMQGAWILELPELTGFQRSDVRAIKAFISRKRDRARLAYAKRAGEFPRQCIFIGSTNDREYLKDDTGGRRFFPMPCNVAEIDTDRLEHNIDQVWAEAYHRYLVMRAAQPNSTLPLYLVDAEARSIAARLQESRRVESADDGIAGRIRAWLERPVTSGGIEEDSNAQPRIRTETCLIEIWCDCLGGDPRLYKGQEPQALGRAMKLLAPEWVHDGHFYTHPIHGPQRVYRRAGARGMSVGRVPRGAAALRF